MHVDDAEADDVRTGELRCPGCAAVFPIRDGLPRFVPAENYAQSFGFQWNRHAKTQLDSYSGRDISRSRLAAALGIELAAQGGRLELAGQRILEAGSGAGRFTEVLVAAGADVVSFDYSSAVDANARNQEAHAAARGGRRPHLFQGDIFRIPLHEGSFDKVMCLGVIQHTPDPEAAFRSLARYVRPGGQLVIDAYASAPLAWLHWKYLLRPITRRLSKETLYRIVEAVTPPLVPLARWLRRLAGRAGARVVPIVEFSHLGLPPSLNVQWAILDTFDMYSPAHDHPQSVASVQRWFEAAGFEDIDVRRGLNGVVGSGRRPLGAATASATPAASRAEASAGSA